MTGSHCWIRITLGLAAAAFAGSGLAFFDGFDGDRLNDYWDWWSEGGGYARYDVQQSRLNVYQILHGNGQDGGNGYWDAPVESLDDFMLTVHLSWEAGSNQRVDVQVTNGYSTPGFFDIARMWYRVSADGLTRRIGFQTTDEYATPLDAPDGGSHVFSIWRQGGRVGAAFDGYEFFTSNVDYSHHVTQYVVLGFTGAGSEFTPLRVDSVELIVPEPSTACVTGCTLVFLLTRRRRVLFR